MNKFLSDIPDTILICIFFALPFIALAILNRNHFGKVICVMNVDGIYYKGNLIKWSDMEKIEYEIQIPGRSVNPRHNWCHAVIYTKKEEIALIHAPLFILSEAKKYCPGINTKVSTSSKWLIGLLIAMIIILPFATILKK